MKLDFDTIKSITLGIDRITKEKNGYCFHRFTEHEEKIYKERSESSYVRTFVPSGVKISFKTNSENLFIKGVASDIGSRSFFAFELFVNDEKIDQICNYTYNELAINYSEHKYPLGEFNKQISLGVGEKSVNIYFPYTVKILIEEISIDDSATVEPIKPKHKLLAFGDSITHGFDALRPTSKYITRFANHLDAEEINKAIGGETYWPELVKEKIDLRPDFITVAYGTNDWDHFTETEFKKNVKEFFTNLKNNYKDTPIIAITPIWRKDIDKKTAFGDFRRIDKIIREVTSEFEGVTIITGLDLVEHDKNLFGDLWLHPNDQGFEQYYENLTKNFSNNHK